MTDEVSPFEVTMDDVAKAAGVSRATVSRVLGGTSNVKEGTKARVFRAVHDLGYVPNIAAQQLAGRGSRVVGLLLRDPRNAPYGLLHVEMQNWCDRSGLQLVTAIPTRRQGAYSESLALQQLLGLRVSGLFVATGVISAKQLEQFLPVLPVVSVGRPETHPKIYSVSYDEREHGEILADAVVMHGHRRVAVIQPTIGVSVPEHLRAASIIDRLRARGVQVTVISAPTFGVNGEGSDEVIRLVANREITAAMFPNDMRLFAFVELAHKLGIRIPEQVSVTGCDGIAQGISLLGLASLRIPVEAIARRSVEVMAEMINSPGSVQIRHELHPGVFLDGPSLGSPAL